MNRLHLTAGPSTRFAFRLLPRVVRSVVPPRVIGCYILTVGNDPVYVGRSDNCLRRRLAQHGSLGPATHFLWQPCRSPVAAFNLESAWYHHLCGTAGSLVLNVIHPDSPSGVRRVCPFCAPRDHEAFAFALHRQFV